MDEINLGGPRLALSALDDLESRYDGPIPPPLRAAARAGSGVAAARIETAGETRFLAGLIARQLIAIRESRRAGRPVRMLTDDLDLYRRERRRLRDASGAAVAPRAGRVDPRGARRAE
jgi:hypothetical protein